MKNYRIKQLYNPNALKLDYVKSFLRVVGDFDDHLILNMIDAAREMAEKYLSIFLYPREILLRIKPHHNRIDIAYRPIVKFISIEEVYENDLKLISQENYHIDDVLNRIIISNSILNKQLEIKMICGYQNIEDIPQAIIQGMLLHIADMYDKQNIANILPESTRSLYAPFIKYKI